MRIKKIKTRWFHNLYSSENKHERCRSCSMHEKEKAQNILVIKSEGNAPLAKARNRRKNTKMN